MKESIIPGNDEFCFICKKFGQYTRGTDHHHMVYGTANRKLSDEDGLWCWLCHDHHMMLHQHGFYKDELIQLAEKSWLEYYGKTVDDFIKRYGKNYL